MAIPAQTGEQPKRTDYLNKWARLCYSERHVDHSDTSTSKGTIQANAAPGKPWKAHAVAGSQGIMRRRGPMGQNMTRLSRRHFVKATGAGGLLVLASSLGATRVQAQQKTLKIGQWSHFVPAYDEWFDNKFTKEWGDKHGVKVIVDHIGTTELRARAAAEVAAQKGHDLFKFGDPPPAYEDQVLDHTELIQEAERRKGKYLELAHKSTFNPKTKKYFGFSDNFVPDPGNYRKDLWDAVGMMPDTWEDIRVG